MPGYLRYIEVENFKSYRGKQVIGPLKPFTAVIGPNGSGKSNFMDAISFVLGEKTQNLRVKKLSELIHGASIGQPVASTASVTLVYEDSNSGKQTRFSRFVIGSSSEYKMDHASVSKQDYAERLGLLGINVKAKNFLVYQGAVESIAMKNPREITSLFEEISRSNDYKEEYVNKKVKMDRSEEELHHMYVKKKGIAAEKKEAQGEINEAKKYQNLRDDLSKIQTELQLFKLYHIEQDLKDLNKEMEKKRKELNKQVKKKESAEEEVRTRKSNHNKLSKQLANIDRQIREVELTLNKKRPAFIKAKENATHIEKKLEAAKKSLASAEKTHANHRETVKDLEDEYKKVVKKIKKFDAEVEKEKEAAKHDIVLESAQREEYNRLKEEVATESAKIRAQLDTLERDQKSDSDSYDALMRKKQEYETKIRILQAEKDENSKRIDKLQDNILVSESTLKEQSEREKDFSKDVSSAKKRVTEIQSKLEVINNDLGDAKGDRHEDDRRKKKAEVVDHLKKLYGGVYDRLLNLCKPIHKKFNMAITRVMGKSMEAIVVDTEKTARQCIQYLKDQMMEPETFLPLDYIDAKPLKERLRNIQHPRGVKLVYDVIKYDPPAIKRVVLFATNNALVCETSEDAAIVAFELGDGKRYDAVALDGTYYQKCGFISGGSAELERRARRWDEKELHKLKFEKEKLMDELKEQHKKMRKESDLMLMQSQIKGLETRLKYSRLDLESTQSRNEGIDKEIRALVHKVESEETRGLKTEMEKFKQQMDERQEQINEKREEMNTVEDEKFADFCEQLGVENIRQYEERQNKQSQEMENRRLQLKNEENNIMSRLQYERSKETIQLVERWKQAVKDETQNLDEARDAEKREMKAIEEEMNRVDELKNEKISKKQECDGVEDEITEEKRTLSNIQKEITSAQKGLMAIECRMESKKADRHAVLLSCKMECVDIPLISGNFDAVAGGSSGGGDRNGSQGDDDDDDLDEDGGGTATQRSYKQDESIKPDFSGLPSSLKNVSAFL